MGRRRYSRYNHRKVQRSSKCGVSYTAIDKAVNCFKYLPRVVPLPPRSVLPCDRPSPYKYVVEYTIALIVESTSLVFMLGRVFWLGSKIGSDVPVLKALRTQYALYNTLEEY